MANSLPIDILTGVDVDTNQVTRWAGYSGGKRSYA